MAKATSRLRLPHTFQQLRRQDLSSRYVDITLCGSSQLFGSPLTIHSRHCYSEEEDCFNWSEREISMLQSYSSRYKTTKVHQYFPRNKINEPTNQNTNSASLSVCRSPTSHALIIPQRRHAHERTPLKNGKKQEKGVRSYRKRKYIFHVFWVRRGATCTLPAALSSCIFSRIMASQPPDLSG